VLLQICRKLAGVDECFDGCRGYHSLPSSFGKVFHVEKRWKLVREMGAGAYGVVMYVFSGAYLPTLLNAFSVNSVPLPTKSPERLSLSSL
jgi:hypothetical protein